MTRLITNNNNDILMYPVKSDSIANIDNVLNEWIRFSSYINPEDLLFLEDLENKSIEQLTKRELEKYLKIKEQITISELFIKYKNKDCSKEEHDQVVKYMDKSLKCFMQEKLTEEEIEKSHQILSEFNKMPNSELIEYINRQMINYNNLNLFEAYILYKVREIQYNKVINELNKKSRKEQIKREKNLRKSLKKDYDIF